MKKLTLLISTCLISFSAMAAPYNNIPFFNSGNNNMGNSWNMPGMNWGNNRGFNNGSQWNMPNMNWGNNNGSNWSIPNFNGGNNNGYGNGSGSNWNMPNFNWSNNNSQRSSYYPGYNGNNWRAPSFNMGNNNPVPGYWRNNQNFRSYVQPAVPNAPQNITRNTQTPRTIKAQTYPPVATQKTKQQNIPMPSQVKGVILAPVNKPKNLKSKTDH